MRFQPEYKGLRHDLDMLPLRRMAGLAAFILATAVLAWRIDYLRSLVIVELSPRAEAITIVKRLHDRVLSYSEQYGRPVFAWTGVRHSSAAESTLYQNLRLDLRDERVRYSYGEEIFSITWIGEEGRMVRDSAPIVLSNQWPPDARFYAHVRWVVNHPVPPGVRERAMKTRASR